MSRLCRFPRTLINLLLVVGFTPTTLWCFISPAWAQDNVWETTEDPLKLDKPVAGKIEFPWLNEVRAIMVRSLQSPDQGRDLVNLHGSAGTKAQANYAKYIGPIKSVANPENGVTVRTTVMKSVRLYAQKETKGNIFPQSWKDGLRFNIGGGGGGGSSGNKGYVHNGNPEMHYGLRLTNIEPSNDSLKLASLGMDDFEVLRYAPKANVVYEIGEVYPDAGARSFPADISVVQTPEFSMWKTLPTVPDFKFSGRMAPRGLPGPGSPLPPQSIFLDQSQGYYQLEAQMSGNFKQEAVVHRFRVPVYGKMNYRQERNKDWQYTKTTFENIYANDHGFAINLERYHIEHRYQLGFLYNSGLNRLQLFAHVPETALESDHFWHQHRWETTFDFRF